jgi:hypothetical protein
MYFPLSMGEGFGEGIMWENNFLWLGTNYAVSKSHRKVLEKI